MKTRTQQLGALCMALLSLSLLSDQVSSPLAQAQESVQQPVQSPEPQTAESQNQATDSDASTGGDSQDAASQQDSRDGRPEPKNQRKVNQRSNAPADAGRRPGGDKQGNRQADKQGDKQGDKQANRQGDKQRSEQSPVDAQEFASHDTAALGVLVGPCPGQGVCVMDTMPGSPAETAGIEQGDYILAINDQTVSSPRELKQKIEELNSTDTINVSVWRSGQTLTKQVALASEAKELPASHRSWLGVMLAGTADEQAGVTIRQVQRMGPASRAGLQAGDRVTQINGEQVESIEQFIELVQNYEPGAQLDLTVRRGEQDVELSAELGDVRDAPMQWFRQAFRMPMEQDDFDFPRQEFSDEMLSSSDAPSMGMIEEMLDDMRQQIRLLQQQVEELKKPSIPAVDKALEGVEQQPAGPTEQDDVSRIDAAGSGMVKFVQFDSRRRYPSRAWDDWRGSRYDSRFYRDGYNRYQPGYRSYYGSGYRSTPYRYYNYGGRPYYYGGDYPYGYRGGIRIGPNLGIWW